MATIIIPNLLSIHDAAREFIRQMKGRTVFAFNGNMGVGKTTFIKAVCEEMEVEDVINSPTFAIINEYFSFISKDIIYHFDFYRINSTAEAIRLGVDDYLHSGRLCFIEWPERIMEILPPDTVFVTIKEVENGQRIVELPE